MKICHIDNCVNNWLFIFVHFQPEKKRHKIHKN